MSDILGRIQPIKRPSPEHTAKLPPHIQEKLKNPSYDIREDPEGMQHLRRVAAGGTPPAGPPTAPPAGPPPGAAPPPFTPGGVQPGGKSVQPRLATPRRLSSEPTAQKVNWGEYSTRQPRPRATPQERAKAVTEAITQPRGGLNFGQGINAGQIPTKVLGPHFYIKGPRRYVNPINRSLSGSQFNGPAFKDAAINAVRADTRSQYFRHAGFGAAIRHTLGIEQVPSHVTDYMNAQIRNMRQTGIQPEPGGLQLRQTLHEELEHEAQVHGW